MIPRIYTPCVDDGPCMVCGLDAESHLHAAPACPTTADSLTYEQIIHAASDGIISFRLGWDAFGPPGPEYTAAREQIAAAINGRISS